MAQLYTGDHAIQIWDFGHPLETHAQYAQPCLALTIHHKGDLVWDMAWLPQGSWDHFDADLGGSDAKDAVLCRLGLLAVALGDGTVRVLSVPLPAHAARLCASSREPSHVAAVAQHGAESLVLSVDMDDLACVTLALGGRTSAMVLCWSPHADRPPILAAGTVKGSIAMWDLGELQTPLRAPSQGGGGVTVLQPAYYGAGHTEDYPIRAMAWNPHDPQQFVTAGQDGFLRMWDLRDPHEPIFNNRLSAEPLLSVQWLPQHHNHVIVTVRNSLRVVSLTSSGQRSGTFKPQQLIQVGEHITPWSFSACVTRDRVFFVAIAYSDGQVNAFAVHANAVLNGNIREVPAYSRGISVTRTTTAKEEKEEKEGEENGKDEVMEVEAGSDEEDDGAPRVVLSDGFPIEFARNRKENAKVLKNRSGAQRNKHVPPLTPSELALDDWTAVLKARLNPNFEFPRWIVSGGLSGVVRCQLVTDM
jgi:hypothetical protein